MIYLNDEFEWINLFTLNEPKFQVIHGTQILLPGFIPENSLSSFSCS